MACIANIPKLGDFAVDELTDVGLDQVSYSEVKVIHAACLEAALQPLMIEVIADEC